MSLNWIVSFNDGQRLAASTITEKDQKINPWHKVIESLKEDKDKYITHIQLDVNGKRYNTPTHSMKSAFGGSSSPDNYWVLYREMSYLEPNSAGFPFVGFTYKTGDYRTFFWVSSRDNSTYIQVLNCKDPQTK